MVAAPCRRLAHAARWNGQPPQTTTGAARVSESHCQYSNWSAGTIAIATTGTVSTAETKQPVEGFVVLRRGLGLSRREVRGIPRGLDGGRRSSVVTEPG